MSYSTKLSEEGIESHFLAILQPRRKHTGFTVFSGSVYSSVFNFGDVVSVELDGASLAQGSSSSLSAGQFYYDPDATTLYVRSGSGADPDTFFTVVTYSIYIGTKDFHWYSDPMDDSSRVIYWEPLIKKSPQMKKTVTDSLYGFMPVQTSSISISNAPHIMEKHIYDSSFNRCAILVYHVLGDIETDSIALVYDGFMNDVSYKQDEVTIKLFDRIEELNKSFKNDGDDLFTSSTFPDCDPNKLNTFIPYVYGVVEGCNIVDVSYVSDNPTTSDNRTWVVIGEQTGLSDVVSVVAASPASTTTRTYCPVTGLRIGDSVHLDRVAGIDEYKHITAVGANYIEHSAIASPMASGDSVRRSFAGRVSIVQNQVIYYPMYGRDYSVSALSGGTSGIVFTTTMEANLGMTTLQPTDNVYVRVYGRTNNVTLGGPAFGVNDTESKNMTNPIVIILDMLKRVLGIPESRINAASFTSALALRSDALGISITTAKDVKTIFSDIIETSLLRIYLDDDHKWSVSAVNPLSASVKSTDDTEIIKDSFEYSFSYTDIVSTVIVEYNDKQNSDSGVNQRGGPNTVSTVSNNAIYLHNVTKQKTFQSLHFKEIDAQKLADRLSYILGDRSGIFSIEEKNRFFDVKIDDIIDVTRTKMPSLDYDGETTETRSGKIVSTTKSLRKVSIDIDDQKGIQDNVANW